MENKKDHTALEMAAGIVLYEVIAQIVALIIGRDLIHVALGIWIGAAVALGMMLHMKRSIEDSLDLGEQGAESHMKKTYALRWAVVTVVLGASLYFDLANPIALLVGVMGLKVSAYLQPSMHKLFEKVRKSK